MLAAEITSGGDMKVQRPPYRPAQGVPQDRTREVDGQWKLGDLVPVGKEEAEGRKL